jgi:prophage regulatory protein
MARQIGAEPDELDAALYARPVPALGGGAAGGMGGGGLTTPDTPRLERRSTARARAPRFCNTCGAQQPVAAFDRDPTLPPSRRYKCTACRERSQKPRPRSDPRQIAGAPPDALLLASEVIELAGISRSEIYRRIRTGAFPPQVRLGVQRVAWRRSDVQRWIAARAEEHPLG